MPKRLNIFDLAVIIPVHNKKDTVNRALESVMSQTVQPSEIIVIDDASTDGSLDVIDKSILEKVIVIKRQEPGPGGYAARNAGANRATSEYLAFLDADDEWLPNHVEELSKLFGKGGRFVSTSWELSRDDGSRGIKGVGSLRGGTERTIGWFDFLDLAAKRSMPCCTNAVGIERSLFNHVGGFPRGDHKRGGDVALWLRLMAQTRELPCSCSVTSIYHTENSSVTKQNNGDMRSCIVEEAENLIVASDDSEEKKKLRELQVAYQVMALLGRWSGGGLDFWQIYRYATKPFGKRTSIFLILSLLPFSVQGKSYYFVHKIKRFARKING